MGIKHTFVSPKVDGPDTNVVRPSDWNSDHTIDGDVTFNGHSVSSVGSAQIGSPTGGDQGPGTINVSGGLYSNGNLIDGNVTGTGFTDKRILRGNGGGTTIQDSAVTLDDSGNITSISAQMTFSMSGGPAISLGPTVTTDPLGTATGNSLTVPAQDAGNHPGFAHYAEYIGSTPAGSGTNGPGNADFALGATITKANWPFQASAAAGEIDGISVFVRQTGPVVGTASDTSGVLMNVQNCGAAGSVSVWEGTSSTIDTGTFALLQAINMQAGTIDTRSGISTGNTGNGLAIDAQVGASYAAVNISNSGGSWTNYIVCPNFIVSGAGLVQMLRSTAMPPGGSAGVGLNISSVTGFGVFFGVGVPALSAGQGSLYLRSDGTGTNDRMYVNTNGSNGWTAVVTVS